MDGRRPASPRLRRFPGRDERKRIAVACYKGRSKECASVSSPRASVELFECRPQLLHLLRECHTRHLHPNVYEWPAASGSLVDRTELPFMNWNAGTADDDTFVRVLVAEGSEVTPRSCRRQPGRARRGSCSGYEKVDPKTVHFAPDLELARTPVDTAIICLHVGHRALGVTPRHSLELHVGVSSLSLSLDFAPPWTRADSTGQAPLGAA
jgi:hypothetical protein